MISAHSVSARQKTSAGAPRAGISGRLHPLVEKSKKKPTQAAANAGAEHLMAIHGQGEDSLSYGQGGSGQGEIRPPLLSSFSPFFTCELDLSARINGQP